MGTVEKKKKKKKKGKSEKKDLESEDWCFVCKDGGDLILCEHRDCLKVYHTDCVDWDDSLPATKKRYTCERHTCMECSKASKLYCLLCPMGLCQSCCRGAQFAPVKGKSGFCSSCLDSVLRCEENAEYDSDGEKLDYNDRNRDECLFKEYWHIIKNDENLTLEDVYSADVRLKKGENYKYGSYSVRNGKGDEEVGLLISDSDSDSGSGYVDKERNPMGKKRTGSKKFFGWGSKPLIEFLTSIGKDTTNPLSQYDVESIISEYIKEKGLFHPEKKRKVLCDEKLYFIFRKKVVTKNRIYNLLEAHFAENYLYLSEEGEDLSEKEGHSCHRNEKNSAESRNRNEKNSAESRKKQKISSSDGESQEKDVDVEVQKSCFASIVVENIRLIYLRKSLVEELWKEPETFESKVVGSFVKVNTYPRDYMQRSPYQLLQVTGIKIVSTTGEINSDVLLQLSSIPNELPISTLSDNGCTEDDCKDLQEKIKNGIFQKLTIVEVEEKAKVLHELIMKDWIPRELVRLQHRIDFMNEKGRRRELYELLAKRALLRQPDEQKRLLRQVPKVIAEEIRVKPASLDSDVELIAEEMHDKPASLDSVPEVVAEEMHVKTASLDTADGFPGMLVNPASLDTTDGFPRSIPPETLM